MDSLKVQQVQPPADCSPWEIRVVLHLMSYTTVGVFEKTKLPGDLE